MQRDRIIAPSFGRERSVPTRVAQRTPAALISIADRLRRLSPSHRDPERFHVDKSELEHELRQLARKVANG